MAERLQGKVAAVTGGANGIGRAIALLYAAEGARVVVADIRAEDGEETVAAIRSLGGEAIFVDTDVRVGDDLRALVEAAEGSYGALHIMTANAGILGTGTGKSLIDMAEAEIQQLLDVNFVGVCRAFMHAVPAIRRAGGGAMTATASLAGHRAFGRMPIYAASKAAIVSLGRSLAVDLAPNIRVNVVSPGSIDTNIRRHQAQDDNVETDEDSIARAEELAATTFGGRGVPGDIAHAHLFLVSDEAGFVTGQTLIVDGGRGLV